MGALLAFPSSFRDYTNDYTESQPQPFRTMTPLMKQVIQRHESDWSTRLVNNRGSLDFDPRRIDANEVYPGVWVGSFEAAMDIPKNLPIATVLNMAIECEYTKASGRNLVKIGIPDGKLSSRGVFEKAAEVINQSIDVDRHVFIHCAAGVSRSATAALSYLMLYEKIGFSEGLKTLQEHRRCINPHPLLIRSMIRDFGDRFIP